METLETRNDRSPASAPTVLALVLLANDESGITASIESVRWADVRMGVDLGCTDATVEVCRRVGLAVMSAVDVEREVGRIRPDWILLMEGHERVPADLSNEIRRVIGGARGNGPVAYVIDREVEFLGRRLRSRVWNRPACIRLVRREARSWSGGAVLEEYPGDAPRAGRLVHRLRARPYESLGHFVTRADVLTTASARAMRQRGAVARWRDLALHPAARLARRLPGASMRDGIIGAILVVLDAYRLVLVSAKQWELERNAEQLEHPR
jgi:hypothetical protein